MVHNPSVSAFVLAFTIGKFLGTEFACSGHHFFPSQQILVVGETQKSSLLPEGGTLRVLLISTRDKTQEITITNPKRKRVYSYFSKSWSSRKSDPPFPLDDLSTFLDLVLKSLPTKSYLALCCMVFKAWSKR